MLRWVTARQAQPAAPHSCWTLRSRRRIDPRISCGFHEQIRAPHDSTTRCLTAAMRPSMTLTVAASLQWHHAPGFEEQAIAFRIYRPRLGGTLLSVERRVRARRGTGKQSRCCIVDAADGPSTAEEVQAITGGKLITSINALYEARRPGRHWLLAITAQPTPLPRGPNPPSYRPTLAGLSCLPWTPLIQRLICWPCMLCVSPCPSSS